MAIEDGSRKITDIFRDKGVELRPMEAKLLNVLLGRERIIDLPSVIEKLWGDDPDGGPLDALGSIQVHTHYIRQKIKQAGIPWRLMTFHTRGLQLQYVDPKKKR